MPSIRRPSQGPSPLGPDFRFSPVPRSTESPAGGTGNWFVRSGAVGTATGRNWLNAFLTLAAAFAAASAGHTIWVSEDHAETQASAMTLTSPGTIASPCFVYCVNHLGSIPPSSADLRTTATVSTTGQNAITERLTTSATYWNGIIFSSGSGANNPNFNIGLGSGFSIFENCALRIGSTAGGNLILGTVTSGTASRIVLINTTFQVGAAGSGITCRGAELFWKNTPSAITGATLPTSLFISNASVSAPVLLEGVDLSALGAGKTLVAAIAAPIRFTFKDCTFGSSVTVAATQTDPGGARTMVVRSDSTGTNYRHEKPAEYEGSQVVETTIVRTGGASDGTTPISWKIVTTANSKWVLPFEALPIAIWNDTTGSPVTVTVEGIWGNAWVPHTDDIWMDVEYLGASANPQGSFGAGSKADNLAAGTSWATSSEVWGGSTTPFKMAVTITSPQQKGYIYIYVKAATASGTWYIDPKATLS